MKSLQIFGVFSILLIGIFVLAWLVFCIVTATAIATAIGVVGFKWWIVAITIFLSFGASSGSLITIVRN